MLDTPSVDAGPRRRLWIFVAALLSAALLSVAYADYGSEPITGRWLLTRGAAEAAAACSAFDEICVEWCELRTQSDKVIPTGRFCCKPNPIPDPYDPSCGALE